MTVFDTAFAWVNAGVSVIPIRKDGSKMDATLSTKEQP